jgi:release factor glutamine methyltransferase
VTTINARIAEGRQRLLDAGIARDEAALDARLLAQAILEWDAARILTSGDEGEPPTFADRYASQISRRARREPLPYITGRREFWNLTFEVSPDVLIPRPETEGLIEASLERFPDPEPSRRVADVCTGSGCVAVALAVERTQWRVVGADISAAAIDIARHNAVRHGVSDRVEFLAGDLLMPLSARFDLIVANPPYVPSRVRSVLQREVRDFEPEVALFSGADGLDLIRRLVTEAPARLEPGGYLLFEFGDGQEAAVEQLISANQALKMIDVKNDLQGIARIAVTQRLGA